MAFKVSLLRKLESLDPSVREVVLLLLEEIEGQLKQLEQQVTKAEFNEFKEVVAELVEAQKQTQAQVAELAEAQKRTEQEVRALAEAQRRSDERLDRLEATVAELVEAQKQTQAQVAELAEAQKRNEERFAQLEERTATEFQRVWAAINELTEAQKRTEEELRRLAADHRVTRERLEGISNAVGYTLEDRAMRSLPTLLREAGIEVEGRLARRYVRVGAQERQVNIYGHGYRNGERVLILGEAKVRPSRKEVDRFLKLAAQLEAQEGVPTVLLFVSYDFPPAIETYLREKQVQPIWSYELDI